jgi:hypothetical protein
LEETRSIKAIKGGASGLFAQKFTNSGTFDLPAGLK